MSCYVTFRDVSHTDAPPIEMVAVVRLPRVTVGVADPYLAIGIAIIDANCLRLEPRAVIGQARRRWARPHLLHGRDPGLEASRLLRGRTARASAAARAHVDIVVGRGVRLLALRRATRRERVAVRTRGFCGAGPFRASVEGFDCFAGGFVGGGFARSVPAEAGASAAPSSTSSSTWPSCSSGSGSTSQLTREGCWR